MLIAAIQEKIKERLKSELPDLLVESFPNKPEKYEFLHPIGVILIYYAGSKYSAPKSISSIIQDEEATFTLRILIRDLDLEAGPYKYLDQVKSALTGYKIDGCSKMYPVKAELVGEDGGVWDYERSFNVGFKSTEDFEEADTARFKYLTVEA